MVRTNQPGADVNPSIIVTEYTSCDVEEDFICDALNNQELQEVCSSDGGGRDQSNLDLFHFEYSGKSSAENLVSLGFESTTSMRTSKSMSSFTSVTPESSFNEYTYSRSSLTRRTTSTCRPSRYKEKCSGVSSLDKDVVSDVVPQRFIVGGPEKKTSPSKSYHEPSQMYLDGGPKTHTKDQFSSKNAVPHTDIKRPSATSSNVVDRSFIQPEKSVKESKGSKSSKFVTKNILVWNKTFAKYERKNAKFLRQGSKDIPIEYDVNYDTILVFESVV